MAAMGTNKNRVKSLSRLVDCLSPETSRLSFLRSLLSQVLVELLITRTFFFRYQVKSMFNTVNDFTQMALVR